LGNRLSSFSREKIDAAKRQGNCNVKKESKKLLSFALRADSSAPRFAKSVYNRYHRQESAPALFSVQPVFQGREVHRKAGALYKARSNRQNLGFS